MTQREAYEAVDKIVVDFIMNPTTTREEAYQLTSNLLDRMTDLVMNIEDELQDEE